ncbi:MAG: hypothetical protein JNK89_08840 [Saprospiraceae bacterium]|nr:hypothetical protein [Saprospiraceae bacterium]
MKKVLFLSAFALCLSVFYLVSCQKDTVEQVASQAQSQSQDQVAATDRGPQILGTVSNICVCKQGHSCTVWAYTTGKRNGIKVVLNTTTHNYYNAAPPGLRYQIFPGNSCSGSPVADFYCNKQTVEYASTTLANGTTYSLMISAPGASSPCYVFTTGACLGQQCMPIEK